MSNDHSLANEASEIFNQENKSEAANPVVVVKLLNASPERVWRALTDKNEMKKWYFDLAEFKAEPGFVFEFTGGDENVQFLHRCQVVDAVPFRKLSYTWAYPGYEGLSTVHFELFDENGQTKLVLTHEGLQTFPDDNEAFKKENFQAGWSDIIGRSLPEYLLSSQL